MSLVQFAQTNPAITFGLTTAFVLAVSVRYLTSPWRKLPPGPPGLPLLGNTLQLRGEEKWMLFSAWRKAYGVSTPMLPFR